MNLWFVMMFLAALGFWYILWQLIKLGTKALKAKIERNRR